MKMQNLYFQKKNLNLNIILIKTLSNFRDIVAIGGGKNRY